jgi:hypothetical protein
MRGVSDADVCPSSVPSGMINGKSPKLCRKVTCIKLPAATQTRSTPLVHETETLGSCPSSSEDNAFKAFVTSMTDASTEIGVVVSLP